MVAILFALTNHADLGNTGKKTGWYLSEAAHPYAILHERADITFVSPQGGPAPADPSSIASIDKDAVNKKFWEDPEFQKQVQNTKKASEVNPSDYDAILFVGGHGTMWDFNNSDLAKLAESVSYYLGKNVTGFSNAEEEGVKLTQVVPYSLEDQLKAAGGKYTSAPLWQPYVQVDGRLVTGQNPASAHPLAEELVKILKL